MACVTGQQGVLTPPRHLGPILLHNLRQRQQFHSAYYSLNFIDMLLGLVNLKGIYKNIFMLTISNEIIILDNFMTNSS
jgi:hypothetical protein